MGRSHSPLVWVAVAICICSVSAQCVVSTPRPEQKARVPEEAAPLLLRPLAALIRRHRLVGTHVDGNRCPMFPSCAAYGADALRIHGFHGMLLLIDRLFYREVGNMDEKYLPVSRRLSEHRRYYDPLPGKQPRQRPSLLLESFEP